MLDVNPGYSAPGDLPFVEALRRVPLRMQRGLHTDETAALANWFVPALHYLESWGDTRSFEGTASIVQPLVRPLFGGHSAAEMLAVIGGDLAPNIYEILRESWRSRWGSHNFEAFWQNALRRGVIAGTEASRVEAAIVAGAGRAAIGALGAQETAQAGVYEVAFSLDSRVFDGRFAPNPWLQELPDPMTKLTWGNAARMSLSTARALGTENGDLVELLESPNKPNVVSVVAPARSIVLPALNVPGHAEGAISVSFGYGRQAGGPIAEGVGTNVTPLSAHAQYFRKDIVARRKEGHVELALTQTHWQLHGRPNALSNT
jgi:molybdopterin-containing oxidoreductase family iron-sulfur binding subunit